MIDKRYPMMGAVSYLLKFIAGTMLFLGFFIPFNTVVPDIAFIQGGSFALQITCLSILTSSVIGLLAALPWFVLSRLIDMLIALHRGLDDISDQINSTERRVEDVRRRSEKIEVQMSFIKPRE